MVTYFRVVTSQRRVVVKYAPTPIRYHVQIELTIERDDTGAFTGITISAGPQYETQTFCRSFVDGLGSNLAKIKIGTKRITLFNYTCPGDFMRIQFPLPKRDLREIRALMQKEGAFTVGNLPDESNVGFRISYCP